MLQPTPTQVPRRAHAACRAIDVLVIAVAALAAAVDDQARLQGSIAVALLVEGLVLWAFSARLVHQYEPGNGRGLAGDIALTLAMILGVGVGMSAANALLPGVAPLGCTRRFLTVMAPSILFVRALVVGVGLWRRRPVSDVLVVGTGALARLTGAEIASGDPRRRLVGHLGLPGEAISGALAAPRLGDVEELEAVLRSRPVDEVYFASVASDHHCDVQSAISVCERLGVPFALPFCAFRLTRARPAASDVQADGYAHFTTVHVTPTEQAMKRLLDIAFSATLLVLLAPVLVAAAIAVKLTSRGPVLFRQERVGLLGRHFWMLKFRSMVADAEARRASLEAMNEQSGPVFKMRNDPRVTPLGRFLRKYSVDELPQLVNVLRGDMSIVGPRPPLPSEVARYEAWQRRRLSVRPGLTCVWQVQGRSEVSFDDWMLLDMRYIDHWSFARDVDLIVRTVPVVLRGRGAH